MPGLILAIDQGTTNTKALLVDRDGRPVFRTSVSVELLQPRPGMLEQDPLALWDSVRSVAAACTDWASAQGSRIEGIALSNQRETAVAWRQSGQPAAPAISWQCQRSASVCEQVATHAEAIRSRSGLPLGTLLTAGKWRWLLDHHSNLRNAAASREVCLGTVDTWLLWKLTDGKVHATDASNASRTGLLNLCTVAWDEELLRIFDIPEEALPGIRPSSGEIGSCVSIPELRGVPIVSLIGDSHAALAGHGRYAPGSTKATYGTGSSLMMLTEEPLASEVLARTIAWSASGKVQYALEGNIPMTGAAVQWVGEFLGLAEPARDAAALAETVSDSAGIVLVPAMVGLGAPWWDSEARGLVANLGRFHKAAHLARAALESIAFQVTDVFVAMERACGAALPGLAADGGATRNATLMQLQSDLLQRPVHRSGCEDLSALGAAWLGGLALGWWESVAQLAELRRGSDTFCPQMKAPERDDLYRAWLEGVERARSRSVTGKERS